MFEEKQLLRANAKLRRKSAHLNEPNAGEELASWFAMNIMKNGTLVAGYMPIGSEIDPLPIMRKKQKQGAILCLPRVCRETDCLVFHKYDFGDELINSAFGVKEPLISAPIVVPDWLLVPLLAFDRYGWRLGYGKGYYDKTIKALNSQKEIMTFGLAYCDQEVEKIPHEPHDEPLDWIVTKQGSRWLKGHAKAYESQNL